MNENNASWVYLSSGDFFGVLGSSTFGLSLRVGDKLTPSRHLKDQIAPSFQLHLL